MSENNNDIFKGKVEKRSVMQGSKSERITHILKTAKGEFPLRLKTSNPFYDPYFEQFEGKTVMVQGEKKTSYLKVGKIEETE